MGIYRLDETYAEFRLDFDKLQRQAAYFGNKWEIKSGNNVQVDKE